MTGFYKKSLMLAPGGARFPAGIVPYNSGVGGHPALGYSVEGNVVRVGQSRPFYGLATRLREAQRCRTRGSRVSGVILAARGLVWGLALVQPGPVIGSTARTYRLTGASTSAEKR